MSPQVGKQLVARLAEREESNCQPEDSFSKNGKRTERYCLCCSDRPTSARETASVHISDNADSLLGNLGHRMWAGRFFFDSLLNRIENRVSPPEACPGEAALPGDGDGGEIVLLPTGGR